MLAQSHVGIPIPIYFISGYFPAMFGTWKHENTIRNTRKCLIVNICSKSRMKTPFKICLIYASYVF